MKHFMSGSFDETVRPDSIVGGSPIWQYAMIVLLSPKKMFQKNSGGARGLVVELESLLWSERANGAREQQTFLNKAIDQF